MNIINITELIIYVSNVVDTDFSIIQNVKARLEILDVIHEKFIR